MKKTLIYSLLVVMIAFTAISCGNKYSVKKPKLKTSMDTISYIIGFSIGKQAHSQELKFEMEALSQGIVNSMNGEKPTFTEEQQMQIMMKFQQVMQEKMMKKRQKDVIENKAKGQEFLNKNKVKSGVVTTASGLQYEVLKAGNGPKPKVDDMVKVHYHGTLIDGKVFDSSVDRKQPVDLNVNGVIKGWSEALQLMSVGSKWKLVIPSELGYGEQGAGQDIAPNSVLIFEIELIEILKKDITKK